MRHQLQKGFCGIFVVIPQHQKGYFIYVPSTRKIVYSHEVVFDKTFSSELAYTLCLYQEALDMRLSVLYISYATSFHEQTGDNKKIPHFEKGVLVESERNTEEDKSISASIDKSSTYYDSDVRSTITNTLEDILEGSKMHPELNARYARLKIRDRIK